MSQRTRLAFRQLMKEKKRAAAAATGILFAVALMLIQSGFSGRSHVQRRITRNALNCDYPGYAALPVPVAARKDPPAGCTRRRRTIACYRLRQSTFGPALEKSRDPKVAADAGDRRAAASGVFSSPAIDANIEKLRDPEQAFFDAKARSEFGPIAETLRGGRTIETEIANRRVTITDLFDIGTTFGVDATLLVSDDGFQRLVPYHDPGAIMLELIRLKPGVPPKKSSRDFERICRTMSGIYATGVCRTRAAVLESRTRPSGSFSSWGSDGLFIGLIIVYQILYADVMQNLEEYATLKAIGYSDWLSVAVVLNRGVILSVLGFLPGAALSMVVYKVAGRATFLPLSMTTERLLVVYGLTAAMCVAAAALAMRPVRVVDPAESYKAARRLARKNKS